MTIGERIKERREALGLSVEEVARRLGKHRATIYRYENNDIGTLPTDVLEPLATVLETTPTYLMGWDGVLLQQEAEEIESGRRAATEKMYRTFGTEHSISSVHLVNDKAALLYYKAMDKKRAAMMDEIIHTVDGLDDKGLEGICALVTSYLRADVPFREIVDTALKPYRTEGSGDN